MLPLLVDKSTSGPPDPIVPSRLPFDCAPEVLTSNSVVIDELLVRARTRAFADAGSRTEMLEFDELARTSRTAFIVRSMCPLEDSARTG